jgi:hypothetical protein
MMSQVTPKERIKEYLRRKGEVIQQELMYINTEFEPTSKRQTAHKVMREILDDLETEGCIRVYDQKIGRNHFRMIKYVGSDLL